MTLEKENFANANEVKWCPGCGDYAILNALQKALPNIGLPPEKHVFVSGIGCAGRLPYYMNAYGFHTIHGRATAVASGLKLARPDLSVWVITGDGDALSIGGNHLLHVLRRNINLNILMFNNQVYGLTKGQFSPTSPIGQVTKTSPTGVNMYPVNSLLFAIAAGATFVARGIDKDPNNLAELITAAHAHPGVSFIEIYQDCNVFNHGAFDEFAVKSQRGSNTLLLQNQKPMVFGEQNDKSIILQNDALIISPINTNTLVHDTTNYLMAVRLAKLQFPEFPVPIGIFYQNTKTLPMAQNSVTNDKSMNDLRTLFQANVTFNGN